MSDRNYKINIVIIYFLVVLALMLSVGYKMITKGILGMDEVALDTTATVDWSQKYPFEENANCLDTDTGIVEQDGVVDNYLRRVHGIKSSLEWYCTEGFVFKENGINVISGINKLIGTDVILGNGISMNIHDGYVVTEGDSIETGDYAANVIEFNDFAKSNNIPLLYVESIYKIESGEKDPLVRDDFTNQNADELISELKENGVKCLDLREKEIAEGRDHYASFFRSDTHWLPSTGLWAANKVSDYINEEFGENLNSGLLEADKFESRVYRNVFLGANGRKVGKNYCSPEDFELLLPSYPTELKYISESANIDNYGDFSESMIDWSRLETIDYYGNSCYASYMSGRQPLGIISNFKADNDMTILFLSDSFGATVAPYMALECSELIFVDPRLFNGSVKRLVLDVNPDIIVMLYNPEVITATSPDSNDSMYMLK